MTRTQSDEMVAYIQKSISALADKEKAKAMAAYMKTEMPFYGVQKPDRVPIYKVMKKQFVPATQKDYVRNVVALWKLPHREEKYAALEYAVMFDKFICTESMPLYEQLVREGAWWDFV